jgi:hypothetical protein
MDAAKELRMRHVRALVWLMVVALSALAPTARAGKSADGAEFPAVTPSLADAKGPTDLLPELPVLGKTLGQAPEAAFPGLEIYSSRAAAKWDELAKDFAGYGVPRGSDVMLGWFVKAGFGDVVTFELADGKINRICVWYKSLPPPKAESLLAQIRKANQGKKPGELRVNDIAVDLSVLRMQKIGVAKANEVIPFAILIVEADGADWYIAHHQVTDEVKAALRAAKLIPGMTEEEARAAMRKLPVVKEEVVDAKTKKLSWFILGTKDVPMPKEPGDKPGTTRIKRESIEILKMKATFVDGKLTEKSP